MLLLTPLVLLLGIKMAEYRDDPLRFAIILSSLFLFCFVTLLRALMDIMEISRNLLREHHATVRETVGDAAFLEELSSRVNGPRVP